VTHLEVAEELLRRQTTESLEFTARYGAYHMREVARAELRRRAADGGMVLRHAATHSQPERTEQP